MATLYNAGMAFLLLLICFSGFSESLDSPTTQYSRTEHPQPITMQPVDGVFNIMHSTSQLILSNPAHDTISIKLYNGFGELVVVSTIASSTAEISLNALPLGKYFYFVTNHRGIRITGHVHHTGMGTQPGIMAGPGLCAK
ncbi:MAG: hypothetical protein HYZ16_11645 [Bacteroidetes bacterium]|nr:hypothetical protein [Bacteroidota bacterium]